MGETPWPAEIPCRSALLCCAVPCREPAEIPWLAEVPCEVPWLAESCLLVLRGPLSICPRHEAWRGSAGEWQMRSDQSVTISIAACHQWSYDAFPRQVIGHLRAPSFYMHLCRVWVRMMWHG